MGRLAQRVLRTGPGVSLNGVVMNDEKKRFRARPCQGGADVAPSQRLSLSDPELTPDL